MSFAALQTVVLGAMGYVLLSWMKRRTTSSTLTLAGLVLVLFIEYPVTHDGPLVLFIGQRHSLWRLLPLGWQWYWLEGYLHFGVGIALALWINYLMYRLARRHGVCTALLVSIALWGFCSAPMHHWCRLPQAILLCLATFSLAALAWRPSIAALRTFLLVTYASLVAGAIWGGGLGSPTFTAFGLKRVNLVPFWVFSTGVVGAAVAAVLARRQSKGAEQVAAT